MSAMAVAEHHVIAWHQRPDPRADGFDDARAFVPQHGGQRHRIVLVADDQVGMAHARRDDTYQHLVVHRRAQAGRFQQEWRPLGTGDGSDDFAIRGMFIGVSPQ